MTTYFTDSEFDEIRTKLSKTEDELSFLNWLRNSFHTGLNDLFFACAQRGMNDIIESMIDKNVMDVNHYLLDEDNPHTYPLNYALEEKKVHLAEKLLDRGADISLMDSIYKTARKRIIGYYFAPVTLLEKAMKMPEWSKEGSYQEFTPINCLLVAGYPFQDNKGYKETYYSKLARLIDGGEDVNACDPACDGVTPLSLAAALEDEGSAVIKALIDAGADVNKRVDCGRTSPLAVAIRKGIKPNIDMLLKAGAKITELEHHLTQIDNTDMLAYAKSVQLSLKVNEIVPKEHYRVAAKGLSL